MQKRVSQCMIINIEQIPLKIQIISLGRKYAITTEKASNWHNKRLIKALWLAVHNKAKYKSSLFLYKIENIKKNTR